MSPKHPNTQTPKHPTGEIPKHPNTQAPNGENTQLPKYPNTQVLNYPNTQMNEHPSSQGGPDLAMVCERPVGATAHGKPYDLDERTAIFGEEVIDFLKKVPVTKITGRLVDQLSGAGTSVGANYCEADDAPSKKAYRNSISTCKREARETKFFIRMIVRAVPELSDDAKPLWQEAKELHLIFCKLHKGSGQE